MNNIRYCYWDKYIIIALYCNQSEIKMYDRKPIETIVFDYRAPNRKKERNEQVVKLVLSLTGLHINS